VSQLFISGVTRDACSLIQPEAYISNLCTIYLYVCLSVATVKRDAVFVTVCLCDMTCICLCLCHMTCMCLYVCVSVSHDLCVSVCHITYIPYYLSVGMSVYMCVMLNSGWYQIFVCSNDSVHYCRCWCWLLRSFIHRCLPLSRLLSLSYAQTISLSICLLSSSVLSVVCCTIHSRSMFVCLSVSVSVLSH